jgi:hypothetical protein
MRRRTTLCGSVLAALLAATPVAAPAHAAPAMTVPAAQAPAAPAPVAQAPAETAAGQLRWVLAASGRVPVPADEQTAHLSQSVLAAVGGPQGFNDTLAALGPLTLEGMVSESPGYVQATVRHTGGLLTVVVQADGAGLIALLLFLPYTPDPRSWAEVDEQLRALAPQASFVSAVIGADGRCRTVHGVAEDTQRPLASAFKLYVLGALGRAVAQGRARWDEPLAVRDDWKSVPSGRLQDAPAGTVLPLRRYAELMISISDNTATDHLIHRLGRAEVQAEFARFGNRRPAANTPLPTTRNVFTLKGVHSPAAADGWLKLPRPLRAAALPVLDRVPLSRIQPFPEPRMIEKIEWFGSPTDMCRAFAGLARQHTDPALSPVGGALSINDGAIGLDRSRYPTVWFKGGSEPGVLTLNHLARTAAGETVVSSVMLADPDNALDDPAVQIRATAIARAAIHLATAP